MKKIKASMKLNEEKIIYDQMKEYMQTIPFNNTIPFSLRTILIAAWGHFCAFPLITRSFSSGPTSPYSPLTRVTHDSTR